MMGRRKPLEVTEDVLLGVRGDATVKLASDFSWHGYVKFHPIVHRAGWAYGEWVNVNDKDLYLDGNLYSAHSWDQRDGFYAMTARAYENCEWFECDRQLVQIWNNVKRDFKKTIEAEDAVEASEKFREAVAQEIADRQTFWHDIDTVFNGSTVSIKFGTPIEMKVKVPR